MMKLVIDRNVWLRGEGFKNSFLIRLSDKKQCCLGFLGLACGIDAHHLVNQSSPHGSFFHQYDLVPIESRADKTAKESNLWPEEIYSPDVALSSITHKLMEVNDNKLLSDEEREKTLKTIFLSINIEVDFIN